MKHLSMHGRLRAVGQEDAERLARLGARCPAKLDLFMKGGFESRDVALVGEDHAIDGDVVHLDYQVPQYGAPPGRTITVRIDAIVMLVVTPPSQAWEERAREQALQNGTVA